MTRRSALDPGRQATDDVHARAVRAHQEIDELLAQVHETIEAARCAVRQSREGTTSE